jgi:hypothetical protein
MDSFSADDCSEHITFDHIINYVKISDLKDQINEQQNEIIKVMNDNIRLHKRINELEQLNSSYKQQILNNVELEQRVKDYDEITASYKQQILDNEYVHKLNMDLQQRITDLEENQYNELNAACAFRDSLYTQSLLNMQHELMNLHISNNNKTAIIIALNKRIGAYEVNVQHRNNKEYEQAMLVQKIQNEDLHVQQIVKQQQLELDKYRLEYKKMHQYTLRIANVGIENTTLTSCLEKIHKILCIDKHIKSDNDKLMSIKRLVDDIIERIRMWKQAKHTT